MKQLFTAGASPGRSWVFVLAALFPLALGVPLHTASAQAKWTPIPCSQSGVSTPGMQKCYQGSVDHGNSGTCYFNRYSAWAETPSEATYAFAFILDRSKAYKCYVYADPNFGSDFPRSLPLLVKQASDWSKLSHIGNITGMYFDFPRRHCFAYYLMGRRWQSGYDSSVRGYVCGGLGNAPLTTAQIEAFTSSVRVHSP